MTSDAPHRLVARNTVARPSHQPARPRHRPGGDVVNAAARIDAAADRLIADPRIDRSAVLMHLLGGLSTMSPVSRRAAADAVERAVEFAAARVPAVTP